MIFVPDPPPAELCAALAAAQAQFIDPTKDATAGKDGGKRWNYANLATFLPAVREVLAAHGLALLQAPSDDGGHLVTTLLHATGRIEARIVLGGAKTAQEYGSELTYARRYALMALLGLAAVDDDDDGAAASARPGRRRPIAPDAAGRARREEEEHAREAQRIAEERRKAEHSPDWDADRERYHADLATVAGHPSHDEVEAILAHQGKPRASQIDTAKRRKLVSWLATGPGQAALAALRDRQPGDEG